MIEQTTTEKTTTETTTETTVVPELSWVNMIGENIIKNVEFSVGYIKPATYGDYGPITIEKDHEKDADENTIKKAYSWIDMINYEKKDYSKMIGNIDGIDKSTNRSIFIEKPFYCEKCEKNYNLDISITDKYPKYFEDPKYNTKFCLECNILFVF